MAMATKHSEISVKPYVLDPPEWDFRFVKPEELHAVTVYEYARSCPWVRTTWEPWLEKTIPAFTSDVSVEPPLPRRIRDAISAYFDSTIPIWDSSRPEAKEVMYRFPKVLMKASLKYLVCCTPAFPARWSDLPDDQRMAALSLVLDSLPPFRDAARPAWRTFTVAVDLDADLKKLRNAADRWLATKKLARDQERRSKELEEQPKRAGKSSSPGQSATPRPEPLSWLGSYRFHLVGVNSLADAKQDMDRRTEEMPDPTGKKYPKLYTQEIDETLWARWNRKAQREMVAMFKGRGAMPPGCMLPSPRWKP